jgi:hypothetical protein
MSTVINRIAGKCSLNLSAHLVKLRKAFLITQELFHAVYIRNSNYANSQDFAVFDLSFSN